MLIAHLDTFLQSRHTLSHLMRSEINSYRPTLWRTCRALMNKRRLLCLKTVIKTPSLTVGEIAVIAGIPENQASVNLRALQARGLITAVRQGRWTRYLPVSDPFVEHADDVLNAVQLALSQKSLMPEPIMRTLRAFTHARRLMILHLLRKQPSASVTVLIGATRMSYLAAWRHLKKLRACGLVTCKNDNWRLISEKRMSRFAKALLEAVE